MNIIYIHTHDTGRYIQPYGHPVFTPNLQQFAEEGMLFRQAFCGGPTCSPSRAALLTGMCPHSAGMLGLAHRGFQMSDYSRHLVRYLNSNGYETALFGEQHEAPRTEMIGYHKVVKYSHEDSVKRDMLHAEAAADYIGMHHDKPLFLSLGLFNTHRDFPAIGSDINPDYVMPPSPLYDTKESREDFAGYLTSAQYADKAFGKVMDALKETGKDKNSIVIFTTDHGIAFPFMKCNLYDTGIGVSLIMKWPGRRKRAVSDALVSHIDIFPTLCDLLSLPKPNWLQGKSMRPLIENHTEKIRDEVFSEVTYHAAYEPMRCVRTERYKLIKIYGSGQKIVPANIDDGQSKTFLTENGFLETERESMMLFDLYLDPMERRNVVNDPAFKEIYTDLDNRLQTWMEDTGDPLLLGPVAKPEGALVNKTRSLSATVKDFE
ncbi:sulfatase [Paenibacillus sp. J5C_2022]|uniref:sulfatase family protein n=1 Tax=Paenibacillus sp. J5C2022 TaxID=2977129 RepID=UPI0021D1D429|nr:sulfatase [Paenibacillus sp. J5C2022]MCU6710741.1 sulfatase [Paenibacillus sp. J5C2022]